MPRCEDRKRHSLLRLREFGLFRKIVDILSLAKRNILISPQRTLPNKTINNCFERGKKKFLSELCELRNFREGYNLKLSCRNSNSDLQLHSEMVQKNKNKDCGAKSAMTCFGANSIILFSGMHRSCFGRSALLCRQGKNNYNKFVQHKTELKKFEPSPAFVMLTGVRKRLLPLTKREGINSVIINNFSDTNHSQLTTHHSQNRKVAFTLAEVLITLGIIGIVASMTMPNLIQNYKRQVVATRLEKFYSTINQAIKMSELTYGERDQWFEDSSDFEKNKQWFDKYIAPNMNIVKQETRNVWGAKYVFYTFSDGSTLGVFDANLRDYRFFPLSFDKCLKSASWRAPAEGRCVFSFYYNPISGRYNFEPFDAGLQNESDIDYSLKYHKNYGCYNENYSTSTWPAYCTKIIQYNGWKIPKDYPYKLY